MSKVSGNVVNREPNEAATEGERNLWMVDFIMDFMGFFCYFHNKIHNKSTYKIIKNNKCIFLSPYIGVTLYSLVTNNMFL